MHIIKVISLFLISFFAVCLQSCNMDNVSRSQNGLIFCVNSNVSILDPQSSEVNVTSATIAKNVFNRLVSYRDGEERLLGDRHEGEYFPDEQRIRDLFMAYSCL